MPGKKTIRLVAALLFAALVLCACPPSYAQGDGDEIRPSKNLEHPFVPEVKPYLDKGRYSRVIFMLLNNEEADEDKGILNKNPKDGKAWYTLCHAYIKMGDYDGALKAVEKAKQNGAYNLRVQLAQGEALYITGRIEEARKIFESVIKASPAMYRAKLGLADLCYNSGDIPQANKLYLELAGISSNIYDYNSEVIYCIARGKQAIGKYNQAAITYSWAYRLDPGMEEAWYRRAMLHLELCNAPKAFKLATTLLDYNWRSVLGNLAAARCSMANYNQKDPMGTAEIDLKQALDRNPNSLEALELAIFFYTWQEKFDTAQKYLDHALSINPNSIPILSQAGFLYFISGQTEKFAGVEKKVLALNPRCAEFYFAIGGVMDKKYGYKFAVEFCRKAIKANPNFLPAYPVLGRNLLLTGFEAEGEQIMRTAWTNVGGYDVRNKNFLKVLDTINDEFVTRRSEHFIIRMKKDEMGAFGPYVELLLENAWTHLSKQYKMEPTGPTVVLVFNKPDDFAVRTAGVPGLGFAMGVCFGTALNFKSYKAMRHPRNPLAFMMPWAQVAYHEFAHVVTIQQSNSRTSRWFTEALSEMEQRLKSPAWGREESRIGDVRFVRRLRGDRLIPCMRLDAVFVSKNALDAYYQARIMGDWIREVYGYEKIIAVNKQYAKLRSTAAMTRAVFNMTPVEFDEAFKKWVTKKYEKFGLGPVFDKDAIKSLKKALDKKKNYRNAQMRADLAMAYLQNGDKKNAKKYAAQALKYDPKNGDAYVVEGMLSAGADKKKAAELLKKADELGSQYKATIYSALAAIYMPLPMAKDNSAKEHEKYSILSYEVFPTNAKILKGLAQRYEAAGDKKKAMEMREKYLDLIDTDIPFRKLMITKYKEAGNDEKIAQMHKEIQWINPEALNHPEAVKAYMKAGWYDQAAAEYEVMAGLGSCKNPADLYAKAAECWLQDKNPKKAIQLADMALAKNPKHEQAAATKKKAQKELGPQEPPK